MNRMTLLGIVVAAGALLTAAPAHAGPVQWCDPASPLYDATICYNDGPHRGYGCDPYAPAYDPDYCAAQRR
jgi:hypothetical protein